MKKFLLASALTIGAVALVSSTTEAKSLNEQRATLTPYEFAVERASAVSKISKQKYNRGKLEVEIVNASSKDNVAEFYVKAKMDGKRIGFGADGSVEIERFVIVNPPVFVPDANGAIVKTDELGETKWTENPQEASLRVIVDAINATKVFDDSKIVDGKIGRTITTVYPDEGTTAEDGRLQYSASADWATARGATTATSAAGADDGYLNSSARAGESGGTHTIDKGQFCYNLGTIDSAQVASAATFATYGRTVGNGDNDGLDYIVGVALTVTDPTAVTAADYNDFGDTALTDTIDFGSLTTSDYNNLTANAAGLTYLEDAFGSVVCMGLREGHDFSNNAIAVGTNNEYLSWASENSATTADPKIIITHSDAPAASATPKSAIWDW